MIMKNSYRSNKLTPMRHPLAIIVLACLMAAGATSASADEGMKPVNISLAPFSTGVKSVAVRAKSGDRLADTDLVTVSNVPSGAKSVSVDVRSDADVSGGYYIYATHSDGSVEVADNEGNTYSYADMWMGHIPGRTAFSHVTIPGTHDSAAKDVLSIAKTQADDIATQLAAGIRAFDLRPRYNSKNESDIRLENLTIYHGGISTGVKFKDAMNTFVTFLRNHPTETVVVRIQKENSQLLSSLTDYTPTWRTSIRTWLQENRKYVLPCITPGLSLGSCRGKIVLLSNTPYGSDSNTEDCVYGGRIDWSDNTQQQKSVIYQANRVAVVDATVEDAYESINTTQKITCVNANLSAAAADASNGWYITYASLSGSPESYAKTINPAVLSHVSSQKGRLGIVMMDFATSNGRELTNALIAHNQKYLAAEPTTLVEGSTLVSVGAKATQIKENQWYVITQIRDKETPVRDNGAGQVAGRERDLTVYDIFTSGTPASELAQYLVRFVPGIGKSYQVQFATGRYLATKDGAKPAKNVEIVAQATDALNFLVYPAATSGTTPNGFAFSSTTNGTTYGFAMDNEQASSTPVHKLCFWASGKVATGTNNVWYLYPVKLAGLPPTSYTLTIGECGLSTLYLAHNAIVPDDVTAYVCTEAAGNSLRAIALDSDVLKANVGYVIVGDEGDHVFSYTNEAYAGALADALLTLQGVTEDTSVATAVKAGFTPYVLSVVDDKKGFFRFEGATLEANRAFYQKETSANIQGFILDFWDADGISTMKTDANHNAAYDLQGRRVDETYRGITIQNGQKIVR